MFIAVLLKVDQTWMQPKCFSIRKIYKLNVVYLYNEIVFKHTVTSIQLKNNKQGTKKVQIV